MNKNNFMGLRAKMLLALAAGVLSLYALLFFSARSVLIDGYAQLEKDKAEILLSSAIGLLNEQSNQLSTIVRDNAHWDDLYQYMHKPTPAFIESSFADATLANVKVNAILIVNTKGETLVKKSLNNTNGKPWRIPELIIEAVREGGALIDSSKDDQSGLFWTPQGVCIVSAFNILDSQEKGPRRGTLIMVRLLDEPLLQHIGKILGTKLSIEAMRDDEIAFLSPNITN